MATIMFVDDEPEFVRSHRSALESKGFVVEVFSTVGSAIAYLDSRPTDLECAVLDILMPCDEDSPPAPARNYGGLQVHRHLRQSLRLRTPIVILTVVNHSSIADSVNAVEREIGRTVCEYHQKPAGAIALVKTVADAIEEGRRKLARSTGGDSQC